MRCEICGTPLDRPGQGHTCRGGAGAPVPNESMDTFALATRRVLRFGVTYAVVVALAEALGMAGYTALRSGAADPTDPGTQASVIVVATILGLIGIVCAIGLFVSVIVWVVSAHKVTPSGPGMVGYAAVAGWIVLSVLAYILPLNMPTVVGASLVEGALRIGGLVVLVGGALLVRSRLRAVTSRPDLGARPELITGDDWDASKWDPEVRRDIDRRRGA